ncbi:hypothetical protein [Chryseobacterium sp. IT-36CA2]|uniref:hypothetical protein n=1 Tax=Chryseobacterium sp. IT-36CA2 TaxID=3026460 RepID=UPI0039DF9F9C
MSEEKQQIILVSTKNYITEGIKSTEGNRKILFVNPQLKDHTFLEKEVFKSIFGENLGKEDLFLEPGSYENIVKAYEHILQNLLKDEHRIPEEYTNDRINYFREYIKEQWANDNLTLEEQNNAKYSDIYEALGEYYIVFMRSPKSMIPYKFNNNYLHFKSLYNSGAPLYISKLLNYNDLES